MIHIAPLVFLCLQGTLTIVALEVAYRYINWFREVLVANNGHPMLLRTLLIGIVILTAVIGTENGYWAYVRYSGIDTAIPHVDLNGYIARIVFRVGFCTGLFCAIIPIWRIVYRFTWLRCLACIGIRFLVGSSIYLGALWYAGKLGCYVLGETCIVF